MKGFCYVLAVLLVPLSTVLADDTDGPVSPVVQQSGEQARIVLEAPTKGKVGELIRFKVTSEADSIKWLAPTEDFQIYDDGRLAVFSGRTPGVYTFTVAAALGGTVDVVQHTVTITGPPKKPTTDDLSLWIPYWAYGFQLNKEEASALAASFEDVADRITALSTPEGIIKATSEANREALGGSLATWKPLLVKIQSSLANKARAGLLKTPEQHTETWSEIARGLRRYAE
jgi:hypothetical protein